VVVTGHGGQTLAYADVVSAGRGAARTHSARSPTSKVASPRSRAKIVAPGSAWPDVAIASELAESSARASGSASVEGAAKDHRRDDGLPGAVGAERRRATGASSRRRSERVARHRSTPWPFPASVRPTRWASARTLGRPNRSNGGLLCVDDGRDAGEVSAAGRGVEVPHADAYSSRSGQSRRLYDHGVAVQGSPALANLVATSTCVPQSLRPRPTRRRDG
jgi:hypothetical protein